MTVTTTDRSRQRVLGVVRTCVGWSDAACYLRIELAKPIRADAKLPISTFVRAIASRATFLVRCHVDAAFCRITGVLVFVAVAAANGLVRFRTRLGIANALAFLASTGSVLETAIGTVRTSKVVFALDLGTTFGQFCGQLAAEFLAYPFFARPIRYIPGASGNTEIR